MSISKIIILYLLTLPILPLLDLLWLGVIAKDFYREHLGHLMRSQVMWGGAIAFYVFFVAGLMFFAVLPSIATGTWTRALFLGALFGFFTYMTYDLTNYATLKGWTLTVVAVDRLWGTLLSALLATASFCVWKYLA
jgi:uncharacterized membrane protein